MQENHRLSKSEIAEVLKNGTTGRIATLNASGHPYIVPVHYVTSEDKIYIHGRAGGQKIDNLIRNPKVGFEVDEPGAITPRDPAPCHTGTAYRSVIVTGTARMVEDIVLKERVLRLVIEKYTPQMAHLTIPENRIAATGIIEIDPVEITGKFRL